MLQAINDHIKGWLGIAIVALIGLPFAFWGIQDYVSGGTQLYAAKVNDAEISDREFEFNFSRQRQKMMEQFGGQLPFDESILKRQVLEQLVNQYTVEQASQSSGFRISDQTLSKHVVSLFADNGEFDRELYENIARSRGMTMAQFESKIRNELRVMQLRDGIVNSAIVSDQEARKLVELYQQERSIRLVRFNQAEYSDNISITEEEILSNYDLYASRYMNPEKVSIEYVELKGDVLEAVTEIEEEKVLQLYDDYVNSLSQRERRKARHILLNLEGDRNALETKLEAIRQQLLSGDSFEALAKEHSQDIGSAKQGGDLGWVEPGQMVKSFEDALYTLQPGELSDIVETSFGLHLIQLDDVEKETPLPLSVRREQIEKELKQDIISDRFYDMSEQLATLAYENSDNLDVVNEVMNLELQTSELFDRRSGSGIAENELVRNAAFTNEVLNSNANSDIIELAPDHVVVLRVNKHEPASQKPLEQVRSSIENSLRVSKTRELAMAAARDVRVRMEQGESIEAILGPDLKIEEYPAVKRSGNAELDQLVSEEIFKMPRPVEEQPVIKDIEMVTGDTALVILEQVVSPQDIEQSQIESMKQQWQQQLSSSEFAAVLSSLKASADVRINSKVLE